MLAWEGNIKIDISIKGGKCLRLLTDYQLLNDSELFLRFLRYETVKAENGGANTVLHSTQAKL
jgi:hypothetical protein